jgi:hypothetical protein
MLLAYISTGRIESGEINMWLARRLPSFPRPPWRRVASLMVGMLSMALTTSLVHASDFNAEEQEALHLQRFIGYIEWPSGAFALPTSAIVVGIAGADQTLATLSRTLAGKVVQGRPVQVQPVQRPEQLSGVHLAYIGREAWDRLSDWIAASKARDVVLATNAPDGVARGATLGLIQVDQRMRFEASIPAAAEVGVKLSARLLEVADRVVGGQR